VHLKNYFYPFDFIIKNHEEQMTLKIICLVTICWLNSHVFAQNKPLEIGVIGLTHTHVHWIFNSASREEFKIVGIVEPNKALALRYANQYLFSMEMVYPTIEEFIEAKRPEAVTAFGSIYDHLKIVEVCAPRGIHVMVEKPLAVNLDHARKMEMLAKKYKIHLLTNYETTWYPTNHKAWEIIGQDTVLGAVRKIIVRDGHKGPKKIGVDKEFLDWLTDPVLNGGGAIMDFGCYGANLSTWIMGGEKPQRVTAVTTQLQPHNNPEVDDEAILILEYDKTISIIQASWNWPIGRKDMEIYGLNGVLYADNRNDLRIRIATGYDTFTEDQFELEEREAPFDDPFAFFAAVVNGEVKVHPYDLSSLENNLIVMEILEAAKESSELKRTVEIQK
jgi:predicted dehydrogenase